MKTLYFRRTWTGFVGLAATVAGYVVIALNAPWFVTVIAILLSMRWEFSDGAQ